MPAATRPSAPARRRRGRRATEPARAAAARSSSAQHLEITIGDAGQRRHANRSAALVELAAQLLEDLGQLLRVVEADASVADQLRMTAAAQVRSGQSAGESL